MEENTVSTPTHVHGQGCQQACFIVLSLLHGWIINPGVWGGAGWEAGQLLLAFSAAAASTCSRVLCKMSKDWTLLKTNPNSHVGHLGAEILTVGRLRS